MDATQITKIRLKNFKRFKDTQIEGLGQKVNILIGDNESGKSSVLQAIDLVLSGNIQKVEALGLDSLLNVDSVNNFKNKAKKDRKFENLPTLQVDVHLDVEGKYELVGENSLDRDPKSTGIFMIIEPREDLRGVINSVVEQDQFAFPYEFYSVSFKTFADSAYSGYKKYVSHTSIDNTRISNEYATRSHIRSLFDSHASTNEQNTLRFNYRQLKDDFGTNNFKELNDRVGGDFSFSLKNNSKSNLETDLTISESGVDLINMGMGRQCFVRTQFALSKYDQGSAPDVILLEEPENHLSHSNMSKLINSIQDSSDSQIFITTHSSLICSRLDLRNAYFIHGDSETVEKFSDMSEETAKFFMKAPNNGLLEFCLSRKNILVEGDSEYMLVKKFYENLIKNDPLDDGVNIISVGGTSFKRYLEMAEKLKVKCAVVRDNDGDKEKNCISRYSSYDDNNKIKIFFDEKDSRYTFEVCLYLDNTTICDELFSEGRKTLSVQDYMLSNKSEVAFQLLDKRGGELTCPGYIKDAIKWIRK